MIVAYQNHIGMERAARDPPRVDVNERRALDGKAALPEPLNTIDHVHAF